MIVRAPLVANVMMADEPASGADRRVAFPVNDSILKGGALVAELLSVGIAILITCEVISRYLFRQPLGWSVEFSEWALLGITFLGAGLVLRRDGHVRVDIVINALRGRVRAAVDLIAVFICLGVSLLAFYYTMKTTYYEYQSGVVTIQVVRFPRFWLLTLIPLGFFFLAIEWLRKLLVAIDAFTKAGKPR